MHSYLRSVGFSDVKGKADIDRIISEVIRDYDEKTVVEDRQHHLFAEMSKAYGCDYGIKVCGEYDDEGIFQMEYYFPYFRGTGITTQENITIEKHAGKESFAGACDDVRVGVTLIFYLQDAGEYLSEKGKGDFLKEKHPLTLSGLGVEGKILFPVKKDDYQSQEDDKTTQKRNDMIAAARNGDEEAMENLTMEDIDMYAMISRRISNEDVYTIVDSYFMPYGIECDQYSIMGEILDFTESKNTLTGEFVYELNLMCSDIQFDVCLNKEDLLGDPDIGRRFKGIIWLQGAMGF